MLKTNDETVCILNDDFLFQSFVIYLPMNPVHSLGYMLAISSDMTTPCGITAFVSDHCHSSDTPANNHFFL